MMVHGLDQSSVNAEDRSVNFKGYIDAQAGEGDVRSRRSVLFKLEDGFAHSVGFWPCGCSKDTDCAHCRCDYEHKRVSLIRPLIVMTVSWCLSHCAGGVDQG